MFETGEALGSLSNRKIYGIEIIPKPLVDHAGKLVVCFEPGVVSCTVMA